MVDEFVTIGHTVLGCARTREEIQALACAYPKQDFRVADVASEQQVSAWAKLVLRKYGPPDLVINNAAVVNLRAPLWEVEASEFSEEVDINIKGVVNVIRHFVPSMIQQGRGVIVNLSSRWGVRFEKHMGPYCATKWAVVALTRVLARELKPTGVAAIAVNPGIVKTGMLQRYLAHGSRVDTSDLPTPRQWARIAVPFILGLSIKDTGKVRSVRQHPGFEPARK
jgi:NAD(P)-dependent dehydrogenase (short-subunit alcohol dehydrogenase family)